MNVYDDSNLRYHSIVQSSCSFYHHENTTIKLPVVLGSSVLAESLGGHLVQQTVQWLVDTLRVLYFLIVLHSGKDSCHHGFVCFLVCIVR
jgi:hypothetical protein